MKEMEERARRVLDVVRDRHNPAPADAARVRAKLRARVLLEPALLQVSSRPALEARLLRKLLLAFGVGGGVGFAAGLYVAQALAPAAALNVAEAQATASPVVAASTGGTGSPDGKVTAAVAASEETRSHPSAVPEPSDEGSVARVFPDSRRKLREPRGSAAHSAQARTPNGPHPLKAELDGLRRAQELLHQGEPAWALARLNELDRAQVGSVLLEERTATRAIAECLLGRDPEAQASEFERRFPRSAHLEQVHSSCSREHQNGAPRPPVQPAQTETPASRHE
jgi:hypothetical protein